MKKKRKWPERVRPGDFIITHPGRKGRRLGGTSEREEKTAKKGEKKVTLVTGENKAPLDADPGRVTSSIGGGMQSRQK